MTFGLSRLLTSCEAGTLIFVSDLLTFIYHPFFFLSRHKRLQDKIAEIESNEGKPIAEFAHAYQRMGFSRAANGIWFREWAPGAHELCLIGEFSAPLMFSSVKEGLICRQTTGSIGCRRTPQPNYHMDSLNCFYLTFRMGKKPSNTTPKSRF